MATTTRYRDLLDYTVAYRTIWTAACVAGVLFLAGYLVWSYVKPPGEDERARADVKAAERLRGRAEGCVSPEIAPNITKRLNEGTERLAAAQASLEADDNAGASLAAKEAAGLFKEFIDHACVARESVAEFYEVTGEVRVKKQNSLRWVPARKDTQLEEGDRILTERGAAKITYFRSGEVQEIRQGTVIEIKTVEVLPTGHVRVITAMEKGDLTMQGVESTRSTITLPFGGQVEPGPDIVDIEAGEGSGSARIRALRGGATVTAPDGVSTTLPGQSRVDVREQGGLGAVEPDLPGPELASPISGRVFTHEKPEAEDTILEWRAIDGSQGGYRFQLSLSDRFLLLLNPDSQAIDPTNLSVLLSGLPPNQYYWRVAAIDAKAVPGRWSETRRFQIRSAAAAAARPGNVKPPALRIVSKLPVGDQVIIQGATEPNVTVECFVNGQKFQSVDVDDDGGFRAFVRLPKGGRNVITFVAQNAYGVEAREEFPIYYEVD